MNLMGEPAYVGRHCGGNDYTIDARTVRFYQDALDDSHPLHEELAPPLLYHSECYAFLGQWYLKNLFGNLHGQQDWELFAPIPVGSKIRAKGVLTSAADTKDGGIQSMVTVTIEIEAGERPACIVETISRYYPE